MSTARETDEELGAHIEARSDAWRRLGSHLPIERLSPDRRAEVEQASREYHAHRAAIVAGLRARGGRFDWGGQSYLLSRDGLDDIAVRDPLVSAAEQCQYTTVSGREFRALCEHNARRFGLARKEP